MFKLIRTIAFTICLTVVSISSIYAQVIQQDSLALVALYNSTNGDNWNDNTNWLSDNPVSTWYGVTVSGSRVTGLVLWDNNLIGTIPQEMGNLSNLEYLRLNGNQLSGAIPPEIGDLTNLTNLYFSDNQLSGSIPAEIGNLTNLIHLTLDRNQLSGSIPQEIGNLTNLEGLYLYENQLSGVIPPEIGNLSNLGLLLIHENQLSGEIPPEIGNLSNLRELYLSTNQLSGSIPAEIGNLSNLEELHLFTNQLSGQIPPEIGNLTNIGWLDLGENQLSGQIPPEIGNLSNLYTLRLHSNQISDVPDLSQLSALNQLAVEDNCLTFEDIESNISISDFTYSPQAKVGVLEDITKELGSSVTFSVSVGGTANQYQWFKDGAAIPGATSTDYTITNLDYGDAGSYTCQITNTIATELTLESHPKNLTVVESLCSITVTSPNGGEILNSPGTHTIRWESVNTSGNVKIHYTTRFSGIHYWREITNSTPDDGQYTWNIPEGIDDDECRVRIQDVSNSQIEDISDGDFSIVPVASITVLDPNGGETLLSPGNYTIGWSSSATSGNVKIEYTTNFSGIHTWTEITASTPDDGSYNWSINAGINNTDCRIKITDVNNSSCYDISDDSFEIVEQTVNDITVVSPNGGETWQVGTEYEITWTSDLYAGQVSIELSIDNGSSWHDISQGSITDNDGSYNYTPVTQDISDHCLVKVTSVDNPAVHDQSDQEFSIEASSMPPVLVVDPTMLDFGTSHNSLTFQISNSGGGTLDWTVQENPDKPWIISINPDQGINNATVTVTVDHSELIGTDDTGTLVVNSNGGTEIVTVRIGESDNLLVNGDFSDGDTGWDFSVIDPAQATGSVVNGEYVVSITNGGPEVWNIQLSQVGFLLENSKKYVVSFEAYATNSRNISIALVKGWTGEWTGYFYISFELTNLKRKYKFEFTMEHPTDANTKLYFDLGKSTEDVYIDNVIVKEKVITGNLVNGDFSNGDEYWLTWTFPEASAYGSVQNGEYVMSIDNGGSETYHVQLMQTDLLIENGKDYTLSFDAYAEGAREIWASVGHTYDPWTRYHPLQTFNLTTSWQTYSFSFIMSHPTDSEARILFDVGLSNLDVHFDNITLTTSSSSPVLAVNQTTLDFGTQLTSLTMQITNTGGGTLNWNIVENPDKPWITTISPNQGNNDAGATTTVTVTVDRSQLIGDNDTGILSVVSNAGSQDVTVTISRLPGILVSAPVISASPGDMIQVPITVEDLTGQDVYGLSFTLETQTTLLTPIGASVTGTLLATWGAPTTQINGGQITIAGAGSSPLSGSGTLIFIQYQLSSSAQNGQTIPIHFVDFIFNEGLPVAVTQDGLIICSSGFNISGSVLYHNNDHPIANTTLTIDGQQTNTITDGTFSFAQIPGGNYTLKPTKDGSLGNSISALDASLILRYVVGSVSLTPYQMIAADVTGAGGISALDASYILRYVVGSITQFPVGDDWTFVPTDFPIDGTNWDSAPDSIHYFPLNADQIDQDFKGIIYGDVTGNWTPGGQLLAQAPKWFYGAASVHIGEIKHLSSQQFSVPIQIDLSGELIAVEFRIGFDPQVLKFKAIEFSQTMKDFQLEYYLNQGELIVAMAGAEPIASIDELAHIQFETANAEAASQAIIQLHEIILNEGMITANVLNPLVSLNPALPTTIALHQNFPNPFNPETSIKFQLSQPAQVLLTVYDIQGHEVRRLIHDTRSAGHHSVQWDGHDEAGQLVSSGVYLYRIEVRADGGNGRSFVDSKKMILMK